MMSSSWVRWNFPPAAAIVTRAAPPPAACNFMPKGEMTACLNSAGRVMSVLILCCLA